MWARQEVVEFHVPGTGPQGVQFSTSNTMTTSNFNTLIQLREGDCRAIPTASFPPSCFDDVSQTNLAAEGGITVMGGTTLYVIVTGYSNPPAGQNAVSEGMVHVDFAVAPNTPPTLVSGYAKFAGGNTFVETVATDPEGPIAGYAIGFIVAAGRVDINGDGVGNDEDVLRITFDSIDRAAPMYTGHSEINAMVTYALQNFCEQNGCTQIVLRVFDAQYAVSNAIMVPATVEPFSGIGGVCDGMLHLCPAGLTCTTGACTALAAATAECATPMELTFPDPSMGAQMAIGTGTVGSGAGVFTASCAATPGREQIFHIAVPAGTYDLALTTAPGTAAAADTVLSLRSVCADGSTELMGGCNDDIDRAGRNYRSAFTVQNLATGDYFALVEAFGTGGATPYQLTATLTPVFATGHACDPAMTNYRCATGACGAASHVCP